MGFVIKAFSAVLTLALTATVLTLSGCSGMAGVRFPPTPAQASIGHLHGSVFGGHAPIVDSHIFLLEAMASGTSSSGYATMATSLLSASSTATGSTYPVTQDLVTGSPTYGLYYVTSDASGGVDVTGDYTCDVGDPVYFYTSGGSPNVSFPLAITAISTTSSRGISTYTFTATNQLYTGQSVQFSKFSLGGKWSILNGTTQTVLATPTASTFMISTPIAPGSGADAQAGSAILVGATNPSIVNLAMVGLCPSVGNFATGPSAVQYVYINEVSTVAFGYAMSGFASDALHVGSSATNLIGLQNAALNAASLYNVQGAPLGPQHAGEGQIANQITPAGNGTVPQAELDTLANILASCVDSPNTVTISSATCNTLFASATSNGTPSGTKPKDIATALINIAKNPGTANVLNLWTLAGAIVPFSPGLTSKPTDFTVALRYNNIPSPGSIAIDSLGNALVPTNSTSGYVTKLSPAGAVLATSATGGSGFNSVAIDSGDNVFVTAGSSNALYAYTSSLGSVSGSPWTSPQMNSPTSVAIDSNGYVYVTDGGGYGGYGYFGGYGGGSSSVRKFNNSATSTPIVSFNTAISNNCLAGVSQIAIDPSGYIWATANSANSGCRVSNPGGAATFSYISQLYTPGNIAIDRDGQGWVALKGIGYLASFTSSGRVNGYGGYNVGGLSYPTWVAIDGSNNLWITNSGNSYALSEFNSSGAPITGYYGYQRGALNNPSFLAVDASGDVWVPNQSANIVTEIIGAATPTVTPLSALQPGQRP